MDLARESFTRSSSEDSSTLSNITLVPDHKVEQPSDTPIDAESVVAEDLIDQIDAVDADDTSSRPKRKRNVSTYNLKELAQSQQLAVSPGIKRARSRNASGLTGQTLIASDDEETENSTNEQTPTTQKKHKSIRGLGLDDTAPSKITKAQLARKDSVRDKIKSAGKKVATVLGKRTRDVAEAARSVLGRSRDNDRRQSKIVRELDMGNGGILDELDLDEDIPAAASRAAKKIKLEKTVVIEPKIASAAISQKPKIPHGRKVKKWQDAGLYVGQQINAQETQAHHPKKLVKKRPAPAVIEEVASDETIEVAQQAHPKPAYRSKFMPLPMFNRLDTERSFMMPFDIYAPAGTTAEVPKDWKRLNRNKLIGEAKDLWEIEAKLPVSACVCPPAEHGELCCDEDCLNRVMQYECNSSNCPYPADQCGNRAFADLTVRLQKGGRYGIGVEVIKTAQRGHGVRASRCFDPGQIIMEYTGEIVTEGECQRRMREDYRDQKCYYLMELERNLVIDGTRGSMARFINHSCEPNCEVRMVKVNGIPRMGVFAGPHGIFTGEELTYDYNFDNFGESQQTCYCGTPTCRGTLSKRLNATEQKKMVKEELERKRKAEIELQRQAESEARKKKAKTDRGSNWRGWQSIDDVEVRQKLREEKKAKEEAEKNSARSQRLAARINPVLAKVGRQESKKDNSPRRKIRESLPADSNAPAKGLGLAEDPIDKFTMPSSRAIKHVRTTSTGSKFTEELSTPSASRHKTVVKSTTITSITSTVTKDVTDLGSDPATSTADSEDWSKGSNAELLQIHNEHHESLAKDIEQTASAKVTKHATTSIFTSMKSKTLKQTTLKFSKIA